MSLKNQDIERYRSFDFKYEDVHDNAKFMLSNELYLGNVGINGPFGGNLGYHKIIDFIEWKLQHLASNSVDFFESFTIPDFDITSFKESYINEYLEKKRDEMKSFVFENYEAFYINLAVFPQDGKKQTEEEIIKGLLDDTVHEKVIYEMDNGIIAVGFGQLMIEGRIEKELMTLVEKAIIRQLLPIFLNILPDEVAKKNREKELLIMQLDLKKND